MKKNDTIERQSRTSLPRQMTVNEGIAHQEYDLLRWQSILTPQMALKLRNLVALKMSTGPVLRTGYDVVRGNQIDEIVHNELMVQ